jgi:hypothetical protein
MRRVLGDWALCLLVLLAWLTVGDSAHAIGWAPKSSQQVTVWQTKLAPVAEFPSVTAAAQNDITRSTGGFYGCGSTYTCTVGTVTGAQVKILQQLKSCQSNCGSPAEQTVIYASRTFTDVQCPTASTADPARPGYCMCDSGYRPPGGVVDGGSCVPFTCPPLSFPEAGYGPYATVEAAMAPVAVCMGGPSNAYGCAARGTPKSAKCVGSGSGLQCWSVGTDMKTDPGDFCQGGNSIPDYAGTAPPGSPTSPLPEDENFPPAPCGAGQCPGTINGQQVCRACSGTTGDSSTTTKTNPDGSTTTTTQTTTCDGEKCTTTTTTNTLPGTAGTCNGQPCAPSGTSDGQTQEEKPADDYCTAHPTSPMCEDKASSFGGSCAASSGSFSCEGDAIQCAMAREQYKRNCQLFEARTAMSDKGEAAVAAGDTPGDHPNAPANVAQVSMDFGSVIDQSDALAGGCPTDVTVGQYVLPLSKACGPLQMLGQLAVAVCLLAAAFIVFRG